MGSVCRKKLDNHLMTPLGFGFVGLCEFSPNIWKLNKPVLISDFVSATPDKYMCVRYLVCIYFLCKMFCLAKWPLKEFWAAPSPPAPQP